MSSDFEEILKQGYLKVKSRKIGSWNKRWIILKKASSKGGKRIEKYQDEKTSLLQKEDPKPIFLNQVKTVSRLPNDVKKHAFALVFADNSSRQFACESDSDADNWHELLVKECRRGTIAGPNIDILSNGTESDELFNVYLLPSPNLDIYGECILQVTHEHINVWDAAETTKKLVSWPLISLRRYGKDESKFTLETGRHCDTGQGLFIFNTSQGVRIYQKVHSASVAIAEAHRMASKHTEQQPSSNRPPLLRNSSDRSPVNELHQPLKLTASYPLERAPLPLPRVVGVSSTLPSRSTGATAAPVMPPHTGQKPLDVEDGDYEAYPRPLPPVPAPSEGTSNNNNNNDETYIYEEKFLEPAFRKFLASRKDN